MRSTARACLVLFVLVVSSSAARADDVVLQWNKIAVATLTTQSPALTPFPQARFAAIIQLAVFEAVNAITGDYQPYLGTITTAQGASAEAAAIQAAYRVLLLLYPARQPIPGPQVLQERRSSHGLEIGFPAEDQKPVRNVAHRSHDVAP